MVPELCLAVAQESEQERAPMAKWVHCMIHREALVARELSPKLGATVEIVTKVINFIKKRPLKSRMFEKLCAEMNAEHRSFEIK